MSRLAIEAFVKRCRRRILAGEVAEATFWFVAALLCMLIAAMFLPTPWFGLLRWTMVCGTVLWLVWAFRSWWRRRDEVALASELERRLRGRNLLEWASALELPCPGTSTDLAADFQDRVAEEMNKFSLLPLVPLRRLLAASSVVLASGGTFLVLALCCPSRLVALENFLRPPVVPTEMGPDWVGDIHLRLEYPNYTGFEPVEVEGSDGTIKALPGTRVSITARADRDIARGEAFYNLHRLPLSISGERQLRTELVVSEAGTWKFELVDHKGQRWSPARPYSVTLEPDSPPHIELLKPEADGEIHNQQTIALEYFADDDFGLSRVDLVWRVGDRRGSEERRVVWEGRAKRVSLRYLFDLTGQRLPEEERLHFFLEACDNDSVNGPKCSRSAARTFSVFSPDKKKLELLKLVQTFWEQLLMQLADTLEVAGKSSPEKLRFLNEGATKLLSSLERIRLDALRAGSQFRSLRTALDNVYTRLSGLRSQLERILARSVEKRSAEEHLEKRAEVLERDVLYLESLLDMLRLEQLDRLSERIRAARDRLEELLRQYLQAPSLEARQQLEEQIAELKQAIRQLEERQREVIKGIQDQYLNPEALARLLEENDLGRALDRLQQMIHQGQLQDALAELQRLRERLEQLGRQLQESRARLAGGRWQELARELSGLLAELGQIVSGQQRVLEETEQLQRSLLEEMRQKHSRKWAASLESLKKRLDSIDERLEMLARRLGPLSPQDVLDRARQNSRLLRAALEQKDLQAAHSAARDLAADASELEMRLGFYSSVEKRRDEKLARAIARESHRLFQELEKLLPQEAELASERAGQLEGLRSRQRQIFQRLLQLEQQAERLNRQAPLFGPDVFGRLAAGGNEMEDALAELGHHRPSRAAEHQRKALDHLRSLEKQLQQSCESGEKGGMPLPLGGLAGAEDWDYGPEGERPDTSDVEIPSPGDFRPHEELRRKFLEGMKDPVPENYRPQVRAYYQELVK